MNKIKLKRTITESPDNFNLSDTVFSGQSFRWSEVKLDNFYYACIIDGTALLLRNTNQKSLNVLSSDESIMGMNIHDFIPWFFSFDIDSNLIFPARFCEFYPHIWSLLQPYLGTRVMRQDPFEIMVTFMCAQGIGMHLIRRQVSMIAERYGQKMVLDSPDDELIFFSFPEPRTLASADPDELAKCTNNNRIRAANIIAMAHDFDSDKLNLSCVRAGDCPLEDLRESLQSHRGIGMKIADCIALFGLGRFDAFPIDTHVKQYLWEWFGIDAARHSLTPKNYRIMQDEARKILGNDYAGYAGHLLFHCWRKEIKKMSAF